ncbi:MAG TPA: hypothetical protein VEK11_24195 [Thermoanaerobaculia bacterium]|jgi:hypothetical protein|nr:hypothetical protein [Thermoanaerobaculia bacterium]
MKHIVVALACFAALSCASSDATPNANVPLPDFQFTQLIGLQEQNWPTGQLEVQYGVRIQNRANEIIRLQQIELAPVGDEGPYTIVRQRYAFTQEIGAGGTAEFAFWAKAHSEGERYAINAQAPVSVRAVAYFDSASGPFRKVFTAHLSQAARTR